MDPNKQNTSVNSVRDGGTFSTPSSFDSVPQPASLDANAIQAGSLVGDTGYTEELQPPVAAGETTRRLITRIGVLVAIILLLSITAVILLGVKHNKQKAVTGSTASIATRYGSQSVPLSGIITNVNDVQFNTSKVAINGLLTANNGFVITPSSQPAASKTGQLYYDQNTNQLAYYNGTTYIALGAQQAPSVQSIGGVSGVLTLGGGLSVVGNQLSVNFPTADAPVFPTHVASLGGASGTLTVGSGLAMNGSILQNSGVLSLVAATPNLIVTDDGNGNLSISNVGGGSGTVTSGGGTTGRIAKFTGVQNVEDSLLSDNGTTVTVNGNLSVTGTVSLSVPLTVGNGGTGATTLASNGVVVGQGAGALTAVTAAGAGLCLISTVGAPAFQACPGGAGVSSVDGLTGTLTIANTSGVGSTITIDDATTVSKGIASFNSTNLMVSSGTVNTIQNINTTATPTFSGVNTNTITPSGALTVGAVAQNFTLQGASGSVITARNGGNTTTLSFQAATANVNYRFPTTAAGSYDVCTTAGNCVGVGGSVSTPGGTTNALAKFTGSLTLADSIISDNGTLATITGNATVTGNLTLSNALGVGSGGTGATTFTNNGVVIGQGSGALATVTAGGAGQCLVSTVGAPVFQACPGSGGVSSLNGLTGALNIANASGVGTTITINDASTGAKGIASFNSTNFSVSSGAVNTIQDIATNSAPTFGQLALTSSQASNPMLLINNTNVGATGALLDLQVNGSSKFSVQPSGNVAASGTFNGQTISSTASFTGSMAIAGNTTLTGDIAVNGGDITSTGALNITPSGTLTVGSGAQTLALQGGASSTFAVTSGANTTTVNFQAPTANVTYRIPTAAAGSYDICTTVGNCAGAGGGVSTAGGTSNRLAKFTSAQAIGDSTISDNGTTVTTTANMVVQGGTLTSGVANSQTGSLVLAYGSANFSGTITPGALTANRSYTLPDASGTFCLNGSSACGFIAGSGTAFVQGGNTFGVDGDLGTNDATALNLRTNGATRVTINSTGNAAFTGDIAVNGGDITSTGALNVTPSGTLTLGSSSQTLAMQGGSSSSLVITSGANTTTVNFQAPTAAVTYRFAAASAGSYDICTTTGNCAGTGGGVTTPGGTNNRLAKFTGGQVLGDSSITDNGTTVTTTANFVIQGGTGTIGVAGSQTGTLELAYGGASFTGALSPGTLTANRTYTLPDSSGTFCLTSGNCLGPVGSGANISLSNLSGVAINTSLLPGSTTIDLGAAGNGFRNLYLAGSSGTPSSNYFTVTGAATGARTITLPDASGTVCLNSSSSCGFATGSGAAFVNGGNNFGGTANLGTNSNDDLNLRTNSTTRITIAADGSAVTLASNTDLLMQGATAYISNAQGTTGGESFGNGATTANGALAVGNGATTGANGVAVGNSASASASSIALGHSATTTASNQMVIGADGFEIDHLYVGSGVTDATPTGFTLQGTGGSGSNVAGADVAIAGGAGTGSANGGSLNFQIAKPGTAGSSLNALTTVLSLSGTDGSAQFKSTAAAALEVQNAGGTPVFTVNTATPGTAVAGASTVSGNINSSGGAIQTAGSTRIDNSGNLTNIGNISGTGSMAISSTGAITLGNTGQNLTLQGSASTTWTATGGGFTTTVGFTGSPVGAVTYNFDRAAVAGTYTICTSVGNCSGAAATLQSVYNNSSSPEIVLDGTRGALTLQDNSTPLGANLFEVQSNGGGTTYFGVTASGVSVSGAATVTGNINTSGGALQTGGTSRIDNSGNLTNIGNISGTGAITIASSGAGNDIIIDGADQFIVQDVAVFNGLATFNTDTDFTLADTENITLTTTVTGTTSVNLVDAQFTNNTTGGTQNIMQLQNEPGTGTTEAMFVVDNADTDTAVNDGLLVTSAAGTIIDGLDVSDADIVNAINFGANTLLGTTGDIDMTYFDVTGSTGSFTSAGTATIQGGTVTIGTGSQAGLAVLYDGTSDTGTIQTAALSTNRTYTLPDASGTFCLQTSASCGFAPTTGGTGYIQNGTSVQTNANFNIRSAATGSVAAVIQGANGQTADLLQLQSWNGSVATNAFAVGPSGVVTLAGGQTIDVTTTAAATASNMTLAPGVSSAASTTGATLALAGGEVTGTTTVTGGQVTIQGGNATGGSGTRNGGSVSIDGGTGGTAATYGTVNIGTTNAPTINIGSVGSTAKATTIHIGDTTTTTGGAIQNVTIGSSSNLAHTTIIQGGNSNTAGSEAIRLVPQTAGSIAIGSTTGTGTITLGQANASNTINVGNADFTTASTQTINIANGLQTTAASTLNVNILSNAGNGNAGTAVLRLGNNDRVQQIDIGNVTSDGNRTLNMFTGNPGVGVTDTVNLGTGSAAGSKVIHIGDGTPSGSGTNTITMGTTTNASTTTIQGGTGSTAVSVQAGTSGTISVGTANANTVTIGSSNGSTVTNIRGGGGINLTGTTAVTGALSASSFSGAGLSDCDAQNSKLLWDTTTSTFSCGTDRASFTAYKASNETRTNTTLANDADWTFSVGANETWGFVIYTSIASSADVQVGLSAPTGATCHADFNNNLNSSGAELTSCTATDTVPQAGIPDNQNWTVAGTVKTAGTAGTFAMRWARDSGTGTITEIAGTYMVAYKMTGADVAEAYYSKDASIMPGDVVAVDGSLHAGVKKASGAYDSTALGIVTTEPGLVLGDAKAVSGNTNNKAVLLALNGRVPVKVSMENGPVKAGDYLTASSTPGVAMKATQPGQMIGKALEDFNIDSPSGRGMVMTFVNLTWANPNSGVVANNTLQGATSVSGDLNVNGTLTADNLHVTGTATIATINVGTMTASEITVDGTAKVGGDLAFQGEGQSRNAITKQFKAGQSIVTGDVLIVDPAHDGWVAATAQGGDTRIIGIALTAAQTGEAVTVAIGGSVQVHLSDGVQVQGGDLLVSAAQQGRADKAAAPAPGSLLGKALGKPDDQGMVWLLVTLD